MLRRTVPVAHPPLLRPSRRLRPLPPRPAIEQSNYRTKMGCSHRTPGNRISIWATRSLHRPSTQTLLPLSFPTLFQSCVAAIRARLRLWKASSLLCSFRYPWLNQYQNPCGVRICVRLLVPICGTQMVAIYHWNRHLFINIFFGELSSGLVCLL